MEYVCLNMKHMSGILRDQCNAPLVHAISADLHCKPDVLPKLSNIFACAA